jgi:transposase
VLVTDGGRGYNGLVDVGYDKHMRINKSKHFAENGVHINGIESFWSFTKRRLAKFNGVKKNFPIHLKECEWRWGKDFDTRFKQLRQMMV